MIYSIHPTASPLVLVLVAQLCPALCNPWSVACQTPLPIDFSRLKNTGVGCHFLLQGTFPTQRLNLGLLYCRRILYHLSHQGSQQCQTYHTVTATNNKLACCSFVVRIYCNRGVRSGDSLQRQGQLYCFNRQGTKRSRKGGTCQSASAMGACPPLSSNTALDGTHTVLHGKNRGPDPQEAGLVNDAI